MDDKITIIEGPPPTFEEVVDSWPLGISESPYLADIVMTRLRTFNGAALVERCHRAWRNQQPIYLEYRSPDGLEQKAPIIAAKYFETDEGQVLYLWLRIENDEAELELDYYDDDDIDEDDDFDSDWTI